MILYNLNKTKRKIMKTLIQITYAHSSLYGPKSLQVLFVKQFSSGLVFDPDLGSEVKPLVGNSGCN